jgi:hypothetical protein
MNSFARTAVLSLLIAVSKQSATAEQIDDITNTGAFLIKLKDNAPPQSHVRAFVDDAWEFAPLESTDDATRGNEAPAVGWWYLTPRADQAQTRSGPSEAPANPWDAAYEQYQVPAESTRGVPGEVSAALSTRGISRDQIEFIEPDIAYGFATSPQPSSTPAKGGGNAVPGNAQTQDWPTFKNAGDFLEKDFSQLRQARERVEKALSESPSDFVRVAFLDTGYDPKHVACPPHIDAVSARNFVEDERNPEGVKLSDEPGPAGSQHHGTGTIGIFGAGRIVLAGHHGGTQFEGVLGGAPMVQIVPMRVAKSVVHLENPIPVLETRPSGTTRAIRYAIKVKCDVISMSHGGLPSRALADAINAAYEHGIAMFFASGDYLKKDPFPIQSPRYVVFPAAFNRTMCVCGVTSALTTYGLPTKNKHPVLRGNWGPKQWMKNAIATFSPNIPWARLPGSGDNGAENIIDLDGQGTSAATPQAAATAALWLQYHRNNQMLAANWRTWKKAEAAYQALRQSAKSVRDHSYSKQYFGNGIIQAVAALDKKPESLSLMEQPAAKVTLGWLRLLLSIVPSTRGVELTTDPVTAEMLNLEIAQLVARSTALQEIMRKHDDFVPPESTQGAVDQQTKDFIKEFFTALRDDPRCSNHLREVINGVLAAP